MSTLAFVLVTIPLWGIPTLILSDRAFTARPDRVVKGGRYRIARRRVRCVFLGVPSPMGRAIGWVDVDTGERTVASYHHSARIDRRWWGP